VTYAVDKKLCYYLSMTNNNETNDTLHDSETNDALCPEDLGVTQEAYDAACVESTASGDTGHIRVAGRRVYAA
jgi:hypothetical protein